MAITIETNKWKPIQSVLFVVMTGEIYLMILLKVVMLLRISNNVMCNTNIISVLCNGIYWEAILLTEVCENVKKLFNANNISANK